MIPIRKTFILLHPYLKVLSILLVIFLFNDRYALCGYGGVQIKDMHGEYIDSYRESHALIIGVSEYKDKFWKPLTNIPQNINLVEEALIQEDFHILKSINPTGDQLKKAIQDFIEIFGTNPKDRLLIVYSGHGYTGGYGKKGFLVPSDTPNPITESSRFNKVALSISQILIWINQIHARHTLFLFDSCFSDSTFNDKAKTTLPNDVSTATLQPVIQFMTAGIANETLPQDSIFIKSFISSLSGDADLNSDQYVTGSELCIFLNEKLINSEAGQTPRYGKIQGEGDFIFQVSSIATIDKKPLTSSFLSYLSINALPKGEAFINGWKIAETPIKDYAINPGKYMFWVNSPGYMSYKKWIDIAFGEQVNIDVKLSREKVPKSLIFIKTQPEESQITILNLNKTFYQGIALETGSYDLEIKAFGYHSKVVKLEASGLEDINMDVTLEKLPYAAETFENSLGMKFNLIIPGTFVMGSPPTEQGRDKDELAHEVTLTKQFYIGISEVTQSQWRTIMGDNPSFFWKCSDCPVENVSWLSVMEFLNRLNKKEGTNLYRLPTEAEWEYSCRAGNQGEITTGPMTISGWNNSTELNEIAWYIHNNCVEYATRWPETQAECISTGTHPVMQKTPNKWGLYDLHGNVYEWCQDIYIVDAYEKHSKDDPIYVGQGDGRIVRGGSWTHYPWLCRSANRDYFPEEKGANYIGFRVAKDL